MSMAPSDDQMAGRVAIVTGGSRGIGQAIAERLAADGVRVVIASRSEQDAEHVVAKIGLHGGEALAVSCDVRNARDVARLMERTREHFGHVNVVINNAGISPRHAEPQELTEQDWDAILDTNLKGAFLMSQAAAAEMIPRGEGVIINIASIAGVMPIALESAYCASKAGMIGLTKALALDWARYGIRVHAVAPGYIATDMNANVRRAGAEQAGSGLNVANHELSAEDALAISIYTGVVGRTLLGRYGLPAEVADVVAFLASDRAAYMTGAVTFVDGGWTIGDSAVVTKP